MKKLNDVSVKHTSFYWRCLSGVSSRGHLPLKALPTSIQKASNFRVACTSLYFGKYSCRKPSCSLVDHPFCFFSSFGFALDFLWGCTAFLCEVWANIAPRECSRGCELLEMWQQRRARAVVTKRLPTEPKLIRIELCKLNERTDDLIYEHMLWVTSLSTTPTSPSPDFASLQQMTDDRFQCE